MTLNFLNPAILWALLAASIPLLIHLLNRRKIRRIPFSTVQFLKRLEKKQMRNLRIRQWLLLVIRTLIIAFLVLAFARPTLQSGSGNLLSERNPIEAVIILDNSLSLNEVRLSGSLLEQLRQAFAALEEVFQTGDRITILQGTLPVQHLAMQENFSSTLWERILQRLQPTYLKSDLDNALRQALQQLQQSVYSGREIYILSDFQASALQDKALAALMETGEQRGIKLFTIPIAHANAENISVDSVEVVNRLVEVNQPLRIKAFLYNHHPEKHLTTLTSLKINGQRVAQQNVDLPPERLTEVNFQITLTEDGYLSGEVETESDALQEDNRRYFNLHVPRQLQILHLIPEGQFRSFVPLIIRPARDRGIFDYQQEPVANWSAQNFAAFDVIVLEGLNQIPETLLLRLQTFVERGGGVVIIPGEDIVVPHYRELFRRFALGDSIASRGVPGRPDQFLTVKNILREHPVFEGLFESGKGQVSPIEVYAGYRVKPKPTAEVLVQLSDRSPLVLQSQVKEGVVFLFTSPLQPRWTQLPLKGFVVPLLYRLIYFGGTRKIADRQAVRCGEIFQQQFSGLEAPFNFSLRGNREVELKLTPRFSGSSVLLEFRDTRIPGNYRLMHNDHILSIVSVNPWKEESEYKFLDGDALQELLPGSEYLADITLLPDEVRKSRFGKELWTYFLIAAFILLLLEMAVARTGSKKEYGELLTATEL